MRVLFTALLAIAVAGCAKQGDEGTEAAAPAPPPEAPASSPFVAPPADPSQVLVEVNGVTFTRGEADEQIEMRLNAIRSRVPEDKIALIRSQMQNNIVNQFIMRSLLLAEADKQGITVTAEDEADALEKIKGSLPPGLTPEDVMKNSPLGEERMREEMLIGVKVNKLLDKHLSEAVTTTDEEVDQFIEENKERLVMPETAHARHILLSFKPGDDDAAKAEKKAQIEGIRKKLEDGADFADLAKEYSDCPSAQKGGDLGEFPRGKMVPEFEAAAFSQDINAIGPVLETKFGYHIVQVLERSDGGEMPRDKVEELVKNRKRHEAMTSYMENLKGKADIKDYRTAPSQ